MKSEIELQRTHDFLVAIVLGEVRLPLSRETLTGIHGALDVLCWALEHDHNSTFAENLARLREQMTQAGYIEHRGNQPGAN